MHRRRIALVRLLGAVGAAGMLVAASSVSAASVSAASVPAAGVAGAGVPGSGVPGTGVPAAGSQLGSGEFLLSMPGDGSGGYGVAITSPAAADQGAAFAQPRPCQIMVKNGANQSDASAAYSSVSTGAGELTGTCTVRTANGSALRFTDTYRAEDATGSFRLRRTVTVEDAVPLDEGFGSRFVLGPQRARTMDDYRFFSPAVWYDHNAYAGPGAIASDYRDEYFYYRESRAALPFTMMQDAQTGVTLTLAHASSTGLVESSGIDENTEQWQVSPSFRYASIGAQRVPQPMLAVVYPGTEGNKVYGAAAGTAWRRRSNPVQVGFQQSYDMVITAARRSDFPTAVRDTWRYFFELFNPPVLPASPADVYQAGVGLLMSYAREGSGRGVPFRTALPGGTPVASDWNYLMGYVGQQIPVGYELLRYGIEHGDAEATGAGTGILNFWARASMTPTGLPATWYDEAANGGFRNDPRYWSTPLPIYLRHVSDGMETMVEAARFMREHGLAQPAWENLSASFGNWLLRSQNPDGSFYRAYGYDGSPVVTTTFNSTNPIRFLVELYLLTGDARYLDSARRAGDYALSTVAQPFHYVGGTADGDAVRIDKEAGALALRAFLSLYDATRDPKWLSATRTAADYTETWMYAWNFAVRPASDALWQQRSAALGTTGLGFIATGLSAVDTYLSDTTLDYYRLYLFTGDQHYLRVARLLANNTKQATDLTGSMGYGRSGLVEEATGVADFVHGFTDGQQTSYWLPWLTVGQVGPFADLRDMFGSMSIDEIEARPLAERQQINDEYPVRGPRYGGGTTDVANAGFELPGAGTTGGIVPGWRTWTPDGGRSSDAAFTETTGANHSGQWHLTLFKKAPFALSAYQDLPVGNGTYRVTAWVECTGGFRGAQLELHNFATPDTFLKAPLPTGTTSYRQVSLTVTVTTGLLTIGFWADDPSGTGKHWVRVDDVQVTRLS